MVLGSGMSLGMFQACGFGAVNCNSNNMMSGNGRIGVKWWGRSVPPSSSSSPTSSATTLKKADACSSSSASKFSWRRRLLVLWVIASLCSSLWIFKYMNDSIIERREEMLVSMCDERARMLQDQFAVSMNHVHALALLDSTFHLGKQPSAIDQCLTLDHNLPL